MKPALALLVALSLAGCAGTQASDARASLTHAYSIVYRVRQAICSVPLPPPPAADIDAGAGQ